MYNKIYVFCPKSPKPTGGYELLHQLCDKLTKLGIDNYIYYVGSYEGVLFNNAYEKYDVVSTNTIEDFEENLIIVPENRIIDLFEFKRIKKAVWWLSVDNYNGANKIKKSMFHSVYREILDRYIGLFDKKWQHYVQSQYAKQYLLNERRIPSNNIHYLSDYLNPLYIKNASLSQRKNKKDIILYNPKKGYEYTLAIINKMPNYRFVPLENMTASEVFDNLSEGKVYIDFGNHPGKDRIPREAAICGCCIITNKKGSAYYQEDVAIMEEYKFDQDLSNISLIVHQIKECICNFENKIDDFKIYREKIETEERIFTDSVKSIFVDN